MSIERYLKKVCFQTSVYWSTPTAGNDGSTTFATPVEIKSLWKEKKELIIDTHGKEVVSNSMIYVLQDLDENGMLFLGGLSDLTAAQKSDPRKVKNAYEIKKFIKTPSLHLKGQFSRIAKI
jgi:hypothetical protein